MSSDSVKKERTRLNKKLYADLSTLELFILITTFLCNVAYATYNLYFSSKSEWILLIKLSQRTCVVKWNWKTSQKVSNLFFQKFTDITKNVETFFCEIFEKN